MENVSSIGLSDINSATINFENCEQIEIPAENIKSLQVEELDDHSHVQGVHMVLDKKADVRYQCMGHSPEMTCFERILSRPDIVSIDCRMTTGKDSELKVPYIEDKCGHNAAEKCWVDEIDALHIKIDKEWNMDKFIITVNMKNDTKEGYAKKEHVFVSRSPYRKGQEIVVDTKHGYKVAKVVNCDCMTNGYEGAVPTNEVVGEINDSDFVMRKEREKKQQELKDRMNARLEQLKEMAAYEMMAKEDAEMAALLKEYEKLEVKE